MTTTSAAVDRVIAALAGPGAARGKTSSERSRPWSTSAAGAGGAGHRLGQVGRVLGRDHGAPRARRRADAGGVAAARADARPDRRGRAGRAAGRHRQLDQRRRVGRRARTPSPADEIDVLLVSPERLANPALRRPARPSCSARCGLLVIDEAHCISDWGFDFRPDYQRLPARCCGSAPGTPVLATTATANAAGHRRRRRPARRRHGDAARLAGPGLAAAGGRARARPARALRLGRRRARRTLAGSGIVYVLTVAETERLAGVPASHSGHDVAAYSRPARRTEARAHRGPAARQRAQGAWSRPRRWAWATTSPTWRSASTSARRLAGRLLPAGRPGRAGARRRGRRAAPRGERRADLGVLRHGRHPRARRTSTRCSPRSTAAASVDPALETATGSRRGRLEALLKILAVDGAVVQRPADGWAATGAAWVYDAAKWTARCAQVRAGRGRPHARATPSGAGCLMEFLQQALDDPDPGPCGRCSVCTGELPAPGADAQPRARVAAARAFLRGLDVRARAAQAVADRAGVGRKGRIVGAAPRAGRSPSPTTPRWADVLTALDRDGPLDDDGRRRGRPC